MISNYLIIDGSYYIFYRFHAVLSWWMKKTDPIIEDLINQETFVKTFKKTFYSKLKDIPKKLSIDSPTIIICKDCKRENIWRNDLIKNYKGTRKENNEIGPFFKLAYDTLFKEMTPVEYLKISRAAKWELVKSGQRIITQGMPVPDLYLIYNGTVDVIIDNEYIAELKDGEFVGEMSFLTEKVATATCKVKYDAQCLVWKQKEFKELLKRNPSLYFTIQSVLSAQVSDKLVSSTKK